MIVNQIHEFARLSPNRTALVRNGVPFSYFAFSNLIQSMIGLMGQRKLPPGKLAVIPAMDPLVEWLMVLSMRWLGLNTIVINTLDQAASLDLRDCACVVIPEIYQVTADDMSKFHPGVEFITIFNKYFQDPPKTLLPVEPSACPFGGHILFTSGTTGVYKKVLFEGKHDAKRNRERAKFQSFTRETVLHVCNCALWTGIGFRNPPAVWSAGGCVVLDRRPDMYRHFSSHGVNHASLTPQILRALLQSCGESSRPSNDLMLLVGGGFVSLELAEQTTRKLTNNLQIGYGSTEIASSILRSNYRAVSDLFWFKPVAEGRVEVVDEGGQLCTAGQEGEIRILLNDIDPKSYMDDEQASARFFRDGYFYPGDMAVQREDGCVRILGRTGDVISMQGSKIAVAPIEDTIRNILHVDEVCIFSGLNDQGEVVLVIVIESEKKLTAADLDGLKRKFSQFGKISVVNVGEFPRTPGGLNKVDRRVLKSRIFDEMGKGNL